jgi:D-alanyl-D-alanine carboxypeptidase/D-alanyl-D-alanine-endopeptidase (penicillin-binding protein 4)
MRVLLFAARAVRPYVFAIIVPALFVFGAGAQTANSTNYPATLDDLRARLDAIVNQEHYNAATWSVKVRSLTTGKTVYDHHGNRLMSPASNSKLYTGALALDTLGGDYQIVTPIRATAKPDAAGILNGDLIISGHGDTSWQAPHFWDNFTPFITALTQAGVHRITGDLVADDTFFHGEPYGPSWCIDDLEDSDGAEISALTLDDNYAEIHVTPGTNVADPCTLELSLPDTGIILVNHTHTLPHGEHGRVEVEKLPGTKTFYLAGGLPLGGESIDLDAPVPDPAAWFGAALKEALASNGIVVEGTVHAISWPDVPTWDPATLVSLGEVKSPRLGQLIHSFMKPSQNLETDMIFQQVGEHVRPADAPSWVSSEDEALGALHRFLKKSGVPPDVHFDEGSGLSRNNVTSADATTALLAAMTKSPWYEDYYNALPIAGVDGTLHRRMKNTPAAGNIHAKTGTLRWANSLSGYVTTASGEKWVFSLMLNRYESSSEIPHTADLDKIAVLLAGFSGHSDE